VRAGAWCKCGTALPVSSRGFQVTHVLSRTQCPVRLDVTSGGILRFGNLQI
jgi:hypothetical protein